jgi:hypothetical protein
MLLQTHSPRAARLFGIALAATLATGCVPASRSAEANFIPPTRPAQFSMAGIPWGIAGDSVKSVIEPRGYNYNRTDEDGDMWFDGMLLNTPTRVFAYMAGDSLVKLRVRLVTEDANAFPVYDKAHAELVKLYGRPQESTAEFAPGYARGKNEQEAISEGKAVVNSHWLIGSGRRQAHVGIYIERDLVVVVDYEGPAWNAEYLRRRRAE